MVRAWDEREVSMAVDTYFSMLNLELDGETYSKGPASSTTDG